MTQGAISIMRRAHIHLLGICLVLLAAAVAANAQNRTRTVANTGDSAPGGGVFAPTLDRVVQKGLPTISGDTIVFGSDVRLDGGATAYGVYAEINGVLRLVARTGLPAPTSGTIQEIGHFTTDQFGNVFLLVKTSGGTDLVLKYQLGITYIVARLGDNLPGDHPITSFGIALATDGIGGVFYQAGYKATASSNDSALVHSKGDFPYAKNLVAATGLPSPTGGNFGAISASTLTSSTSGLVAFTATVDGGEGGIFTGLAGNMARASSAVDASANLTLADNDEVEVSYTQPSSPGIKTVMLTGTTTFVPTGTPAPRTKGTINFGAFQIGMAADREGSIYFFAPIAGDSDHGAGLFVRDRFTNQVKSIVIQGDQAAGDVSGVFGLFALVANTPARVANDDGKVVFAATAGSTGLNAGIFTTLGIPEGLIPSIASVAVKGKKLIVTGAGYETGAQILINGTPVVTKNAKDTPSIKLQSKAASSIAPGATVSITVRNPTGTVSAPFSYTRPR